MLKTMARTKDDKRLEEQISHYGDRLDIVVALGGINALPPAPFRAPCWQAAHSCPIKIYGILQAHSMTP